MTNASSTGSPDGRDIVRQVAVISSVVFMVIAAFIGSGAAGGTPIQEALGGALDSDASYLAPARPAFTIWSVIYGGLILYAIWQALPVQRAARRQRLLGWWIALTAVLNGGWILVVQFGTLLLSVVTIILLLAVLAFVWRRTVLTREPGDGVLDSVLIDGVTGLHFGWVTIATVANITAQLTQVADDGWADAAGFWGVVVLLVALAIGTAISVWSKGRITPALAIAWGVLWIGVGRIADEPRQTAIGVTAILVAVLLVAVPVAITVARRARGVAPARL
ncbi:tryptophan-rich sensory protein [Microbacterium sp. DT81.1]|uniref:tryptophan-rich sensory protein n=1 Tax=Microbacterium sp. DT81.1 TaxID=3393413 RepID=UPI003CEA83B7